MIDSCHQFVCCTERSAEGRLRNSLAAGVFTSYASGPSKMLKSLPAASRYALGRRQLPVGAEPDALGTAFRVWAPERKSVSVCMEDGAEYALVREENGYYGGHVPGVSP